MRDEVLTQVRERTIVGDHIFCLWVLLLPFGAHSISEEVVGFSPLWFPRGKYLCLLYLVIIVVHVILSNKILKSYCLNDKNITDMRKGFNFGSQGIVNITLELHTMTMF